MGTCWSGKTDDSEDLGDRVRVTSSSKNGSFSGSSRTGTDSIPITPVKPNRSNLVSNLGKSVSDKRTQEEEELFRNIVSATAKNFIDTSSIGLNTPMPNSAVVEIRDHYLSRFTSAKLPDDSDEIAAFDLLPSGELATGRCDHIQVLSVGLVSMVDASQREQAAFFFPASSKMFQAHDAMRVNYVGDFIVTWDDASMAAESLEDAAVRDDSEYSGMSDPWARGDAAGGELEFGSRPAQQPQAIQF
eukprot:TRINITY_DN1739_c0_g1_i2.p1 TRINITY_DN1739_c0_g1~~TRINITY_DN1739_c0_g1_i2.p1  ORF type:complete len:245 (-),score=44.72 TRINITY_DN1739_c0_g1_i2:1049-1783(-)